MAKSLALCFSLCLLVLFNGCLASRQQSQQQQQNECQLNRLQAREPDNRIESEAGQIESWNYNDDDFQCAGVAAVRVTIEQNGLHLPSYSNAPQLIYIVKGRGVLGTVFPGCPETFEEPQQSQDRRQGQQDQDRQQEQDPRQRQQEHDRREREQGQDRRQGEQEQDRQQRQQEQDRQKRQQQHGRRQGQQQQQGRQQFEELDRHQKIRRIREGDLIAIPAGVAYWSYNEGDQELVAVSLLDTSNDQNQLDSNPRRFYLAGNPQDEFEQQQQGHQGSRQQHQREQQRDQDRDQSPRGERGQQQRDQDRQREQDGRQRQQQGNSNNNIFAGFDTNLLAEALNVDSETARQLQGQNDQNRNQIVRVKGRLDFVHPPRSRDPQQEQQQQEREQREREQRRQQGGRQQESRGSRDNGLEETFCNLRIKENIGKASSADVFTPQAGRISFLNSNNLPILRWLGLSAERGFFYNNAIYSPHWNLVAHEVFYVIRGNARVQVVNHQGEAILDDEVREGQLFIVPQNHAVLHKAGNQGFEYVAFKTEDNAVINTLAGRTSVLRALPDEVIANAYQVDREQARRLKYNRQETTALSSSQQSSSSPRDRSRWAIA